MDKAGEGGLPNVHMSYLVQRSAKGGGGQNFQKTVHMHGFWNIIYSFWATSRIDELTKWDTDPTTHWMSDHMNNQIMKCTQPYTFWSDFPPELPD